MNIRSKLFLQIMSGVPVPTVRLPCYAGYTSFAMWRAPPSVSIISLVMKNIAGEQIKSSADYPYILPS